MAFVDDDVLQVPQEHRPAGMVAQQRQVNHVGVGEDPPRPFPGEASHFGWAVAVIRARCDVAQRRHRFGERDRSAQLVVAERLGGRQIENPGARISLQRRQYGQLVGHRLAGGRSGAQYDVASGVREVGGGDLMRPRRLDAAINKRLHHIWIGPLRPRVIGVRAAGGDRRHDASGSCPPGLAPSTAQASSSRPKSAIPTWLPS